MFVGIISFIGEQSYLMFSALFAVSYVDEGDAEADPGGSSSYAAGGPRHGTPSESTLCSGQRFLRRSPGW